MYNNKTNCILEYMYTILVNAGKVFDPGNRSTAEEVYIFCVILKIMDSSFPILVPIIFLVN